MKQNLFDISLNETTALKGLALMMMLWHHLFCWPPDTDLFDKVCISNFDFLYYTSVFGRICVDIFLLLSGYGLTVKHYNKPLALRDFFKRRFSKLYFNYWIIWLIFIPIGYLFFERTIDTVYPPDDKYQYLIAEFFGIKDLFGDVQGFNFSWWFYTCIIIMYLLFPILNKLNNRGLLIVTAIAVVITFIPLPLPPAFRCYFLTFLVGIWMGRFRFCSSHSIFRSPIFWLSMVLLTIALRLYFFYYNHECINYAIAASIVMSYCSLSSVPVWISTPLCFIGKHSMNIFLFHTFINNFYCLDFIYMSRNPLVIFLTLLLVCLVISMCVDKVKQGVNFVGKRLKVYNPLAKF